MLPNTSKTCMKLVNFSKIFSRFFLTFNIFKAYFKEFQGFAAFYNFAPTIEIRSPPPKNHACLTGNSFLVKMHSLEIQLILMQKRPRKTTDILKYIEWNQFRKPGSLNFSRCFTYLLHFGVL